MRGVKSDGLIKFYALKWIFSCMHPFAGKIDKQSFLIVLFFIGLLFTKIY